MSTTWQDYSLDVTHFGPHTSFNGAIPEPWRNPVTVGIGVLCEGARCAVLASDMRITYGKMNVSPHDLTGKQFSFPPFNLAGAIAGSTSSTHAVFSELAGELRILLQAYVKAKEEHLGVQIQMSFKHIRDALEVARKKELRRLQGCAMEAWLGVSVQDWIAGELSDGRPFNELAHEEGRRALRQAKEEMENECAVLLVGFLKDEPIFFRGLGASPIEISARPSILVIGGKGAVEAFDVLVTRKQDSGMGIARTLLHIYEAMKVARYKDKGVGAASGYVVIRPHSCARPNGTLRFHPNHPTIRQWSKEYALRDTEPLETTFANDLINGALYPAHSPRSQWLGPRELMQEL